MSGGAPVCALGNIGAPSHQSVDTRVELSAGLAYFDDVTIRVPSLTWRAGLIGGALCACVAIAPALAAGSSATAVARMAFVTPVAASAGGLGAFTPSAPDPVLARLLHSVPGDAAPVGTKLRFTPTQAPVLPQAATVATHARSIDLSSNLRVGRGAIAAPTLADSSEVAVLAIRPLSYKLGESVGWKTFSQRAPAGSIDRAIIRSAPVAEVAGPSRPSRFDSDFKLQPSDPSARPGRALVTDPSLDVEAAARYRVSRSIDLKAGLRYRMNRGPVEVDRQNSSDGSAVYVGTAFKF